MVRKRSKVSRDVVERMYLDWLKGATLRDIARAHGGICHSTVQIWFKKTFGQAASSPRALSLYRSLLEDNPGNPEIEAWVIAKAYDPETWESDITHRSMHSMSQLSRFQVVREPKLMEYLAPVGNNPWDYVEPERLDFLRLPLFLLLVRATTGVLRDIANEQEG